MTTLDNLKELERDMRKHTHNLIASNYLSLEDLCECIEALEKQIPKKQIEKFDNNKRLYCSTCGAYHGIYGDVIIHTSSKYCCWCGQAIDWSDEE